MHIAIVGSGAMGQLFGARLLMAGNNVVFIETQQDKIDALNTCGITLVDESGSAYTPVTVKRASEETGIFDLVAVFTKGFHTRSAISSVRHLCNSHTLGLTLQNGLGNADVLAEVLGRDRVLAGVTDFPADPREPGVVATATEGSVRLGSLWNYDIGANVVDVFDKAGLNAVLEKNVTGPIWEKITFNSALNTISAVTGLTVDEIGARPSARNIVEQVVRECDAVARAQNTGFAVDNVYSALENAFQHHIGHKTSMLLDREAGRQTEIDFIGGAVVELGHSSGVPSPVLDTLCKLVRTVTEQNTEE